MNPLRNPMSPEMSRLIIHIPHASTHIPLRDGFLVDGARIERELLTLTDWHTDDLFVDAARDDHPVTAGFSRIFCDVERFADDHREVMAKFGMGVLYETTDAGEPMRNVTPELRKRILERYYRPHHARLEKAVEADLDRVGRAVIVDAHSYPDIPLKRDLDQRRPRPDFNIGTDPFLTPQELVDASVRFFEERGYSLGVDWPYKGTIVPLAWHGKDKRVASIMLEVNRRLYLEDGSSDKNGNYDLVRQIIQDYLDMIASNVTA